MSEGLSIAVAGATGAVGEELLTLLGSERLPVREVRALASARSVGRTVRCGSAELRVEELTDEALDGVDLAFFSCGGARSLRYAPPARERGVTIIDNSSVFRLEPDVPLVIPEINASDAEEHNGLLAVPNCTTIVFLMAATPLHRAAGLKRAVVSSYQAASGAGRAALEELNTQMEDHVAGRPIRAEVLPRRILGNVIPHVDAFRDDGFTKEERKLFDETRRILHDDEVSVVGTCVRVPVERAHAVSAALELRRPVSREEAISILSSAPGVRVVDGGDGPDYPTPLDAAGGTEVLVGRVREDPSREGGLLLWAVGDQLLKGAAWNALQIAEHLVATGRVATGRFASGRDGMGRVKRKGRV